MAAVEWRRLSDDVRRKKKRSWKSVYLNLGVHAEQSEERVHVDESLSGLSVDCAEKVEGHRELKQQSVYHHQISHGHGSFQNKPRRKELESQRCGRSFTRRIKLACMGDAQVCGKTDNAR